MPPFYRARAKKQIPISFMNITLCILMLVLLHAGACSAAEPIIPQTNQVIFTSGAWTPSVEDTQKALQAIQSCLEKSSITNDDPYANKDAMKVISKKFKEYRVQFIGELREGKKLVKCGFFLANGPKDLHPDWKQGPFFVPDMVHGGGDSYWKISYDPATGKCMNFYSNAPE